MSSRISADGLRALAFLGLATACCAAAIGADLDPLGDRFELEGIDICRMTNGDLAVTWFESIAGQTSLLRIYGPLSRGTSLPRPATLSAS